MLKSFIELNLQSKHDKSQYQIKKNKLIWLKNKQLVFRSNQGSINHNQQGQKNGKQNQQVNFDCITYDYKSTNQKILYELVMIKKQHLKAQNLTSSSLMTTLTNYALNSTEINEHKQPIRLTITFNYDIDYEKLQQLLIELMEIKKFQLSQFQIAHFQLRNNHVSDFNKSHTHKHPLKVLNKQSDEMDKFTKQIDTCIKLDKTYNIKENINFKQFTKQNFKTKDILNKNSRTNYDKKTNQFFILNIDQQYELNFIIFHRQKDYVLTKAEEKEIEEAFVLNKGESERGRVKLEFTTSLAQILQSFLNQSDQVIFISQYPTINHSQTLAQQLHLPILIDPNQPSSISTIIQEYNKQKQSKLEIQMQKMKVKLRQLRHKRKTTQQNIGYLMKKYKKGFQNIFDSLSYLKKNNIHDIKAYKDNLQIQIKQKQEDIKDTLQQLQQINLDMIQSSQRNQYFMQKMQYLKQTLQQDLDDIEVNYKTRKNKNGLNELGNNQKELMKEGNKSFVTNNQNFNGKNNSSLKQSNNNKEVKNKPTSTPKRNISPSSIDINETILKKFLQVQQASHPFEVQMQRQVQKYTNQLRQNIRQRLIKSRQVDQFHSVMEQLRKRVSKNQFTKLQQKYLALISMC